jgi:uncharacterized protein (DUF1800 family)
LTERTEQAMAINSLKELKADQFDQWKAQHLLNRAGFGGTPAQIDALTKLGLEGAVDYIVDYQSSNPTGFEPVAGDEFDKDIMRPANAEEQKAVQQARRSGDERALEQLRLQRQRQQAADRQQIGEMQKWWLKRIIETSRPLEEKMTLFWHGHFATGYRAIEDSYHMFAQNQFFRANATANFADLVYGIIRDPAMLEFLNNDQNRREKPNENLARELMELFTLGEGHDYTEDDIKQGARALTGYTYEDDTFEFRARVHDDGQKTILGKTGNFDGIDFCNIILSRPVCSEFISWKLYRYFVNDMPGKPDKDSQGYILKLAKKMRDGQYAIKPVLKTLFMSEHFYDDDNIAGVIKSPTQLTVQTIRSLHTPARNLTALISASDMMGQNLFFPPNVKGWDGGRAWINTSTMFVRQNLAVYLLTGRRPDAAQWQEDGSDYDATHLIASLDRSADGEVDVRQAIIYLMRFNLGTQPHASRVDTLVEYVTAHGGKLNNQTLVKVLCLITAMPEYQLC